MKAVLIGEGAGASMETIMAVYPRHKAVADKFIESGDVIGIGPFTDAIRGNMAIFKSREAAERFAKEDPFIWKDLSNRLSFGIGMTVCCRNNLRICE
jgi:uncharacterized protein YciI